MFEVERDFAGLQRPGARPYQEDSQGFAVLSEREDGGIETLLVVLADGMGGENAGDYASQTVVDTFVAYCHTHYHSDRVPEMLTSAMQVANEKVADAIVRKPSLEGMGSTLLAAVVSEDSLYWLSVGDSPLYLFRDGKLSQINEDHSMMPVLLKLVEEGDLEEAELATHPDRNVLRSAIIGDEIELIDCPDQAIAMQAGDVLLVASDGLQTLEKEEIELRLTRHKQLPADGLARILLRAVERAANPKQDNVSINVVCLPGLTRTGDVDEDWMSKTRILRRGEEG
ncbi:serine/threonine-protein phosphatase [Verrucomicrobiaceae bacterium N1E253]|uniref:Serine/threonine-protein phosphatase n=1 Tax=Oceaniferula marina TaxID=2748318 RepID=A0A851GEE4_9BACT|nr:protein phosphatase 2C domain-containing protein [Oceaniferula marina]NWK54081.1 serine/threonine-protein phosphatase [Oceaniferula marina]